MGKSKAQQETDLLNKAEADRQAALAARKPYAASEAIVRQQALADSALLAPDSIGVAMKAQAAAKASQLAGWIGRNATSSSGSILGATLAVQQENSQDQQADIAAAQHHQQLVANDQIATAATQQAHDTEYSTNEQQMLEYSLQRAANETAQAYAQRMARLKAKNDTTNAIISSVGQITAAAVGGSGGGGSSGGLSSGGKLTTF